MLMLGCKLLPLFSGTFTMQSDSPFFSVIIPTFNRKQMLLKAINSVLDQTFSNFEVIVIDDGSTDDTASMVKSIADERVRYIYQENQERSAARNNGIRQSRGKYICFLDNDDLYLPNHLETFYNEIVDRQYEEGLYMTGHVIEEAGNEVSRSVFYNDSFRNPVDFMFKTLPFPQDMCVPRHIMLNNMFPEQFNIFEDGHVWMRIVSRYPLIAIPEHTCIITEHPGRSTNDIFQRINVDYLKTYANCMQHLFENYGVIIEPFVPKSYWNKFIVSKLTTVAAIAVKKGMYSEARRILGFMIIKKPLHALRMETLKLTLMSVR